MALFGSSSVAAGTGQTNPWLDNLNIRRLWVHGGGEAMPNIPAAIDMWQALNPNLPSGVGPGSVITQQLRNVGLIKRLLVRITANVTAGAAVGGQALTPLGLANLISNVQFTDLANNTRINTTGWHLIAVSSAKRRRVFGASYTSDTPFGYGNIYTTVQQAPATIAANGNANIQLMLEIPFAYSDHDLRGAIFGSVTQSTMQVAITLNPNMFVATGSDPTLAVYQSAAANTAGLNSVAVQIYQNYLDQGPRDPNGLPVLPMLDLGTAYILNNTSSALPVANQDNATPFINARQFQSLTFVYDNAGTLNIGTDINSIAIVSANYTNIKKVDPFTAAFFGRNIIGDDFPKGMYYLDFRHRPVDTDQYGNMQFIFNPSSVGGSSAVVLFGYEAFGFIGQINQGGSLPSGGGA